MTYDFDDEDNSWINALVTEVPIPAVKARTKRKTTGKGLWKMSPEACAKISAGNKGKVISAEHRARLSFLNKGKKLGPSPLRGRKHTPETCALISERLRGHIKGPPSAQHRAAISARHSRPVMTPSGVFPSRKAAVAWAKENGLLNPGVRLDQWLKTHPKMFYYLDGGPVGRSAKKTKKTKKGSK